MRCEKLLVWCAVAVLAALLCCRSLAAAEPAWKVGLAQAKITPEKPLWLAGYAARNRPAEGTLHDLWLKVLVLEAADGKRAVLLTSDLLGWPRAMSESVCVELKTRCGLERSQIMLSASHTHSGPVLQDALYDIYPLDEKQRAMIAEYSAALVKTAVATVVKALSQLTPANLGAGEGTTNFAVNRRNNPQLQVEDLLARGQVLKGPVNHDVPVLAVRAPQGRLLAVVCGYACHCTTLDAYQWSGDYAGFTQLALEESHPGTMAMFWAGCGSDQNPLPRREVAICRRYGNMLAAAVEEVLRTPLRPIAPQLRTGFQVLDLGFQQPPSEPQLQALAEKGGYEGRWAGRLLKELKEGKAFAKSYPYPVQVWKLGAEQLWISLGGEVVVDYSLRLKAKYGPHTWITGYANDVMAYIPSRRVWEEGGYEAGAFSVYGLPTQRWTPDIEEEIITCIDRLVKSVQ
jgi:neutral ceramidase